MIYLSPLSRTRPSCASTHSSRIILQRHGATAKCLLRRPRPSRRTLQISYHTSTHGKSRLRIRTALHCLDVFRTISCTRQRSCSTNRTSSSTDILAVLFKHDRPCSATIRSRVMTPLVLLRTRLLPKVLASAVLPICLVELAPRHRRSGVGRSIVLVVSLEEVQKQEVHSLVAHKILSLQAVRLLVACSGVPNLVSRTINHRLPHCLARPLLLLQMVIRLAAAKSLVVML